MLVNPPTVACPDPVPGDTFRQRSGTPLRNSPDDLERIFEPYFNHAAAGGRFGAWISVSRDCEGLRGDGYSQHRTGCRRFSMFIAQVENARHRPRP